MCVHAHRCAFIVRRPLPHCTNGLYCTSVQLCRKEIQSMYIYPCLGQRPCYRYVEEIQPTSLYAQIPLPVSTYVDIDIQTVKWTEEPQALRQHTLRRRKFRKAACTENLFVYLCIFLDQLQSSYILHAIHSLTSRPWPVDCPFVSRDAIAARARRLAYKSHSLLHEWKMFHSERSINNVYRGWQRKVSRAG